MTDNRWSDQYVEYAHNDEDEEDEDALLVAYGLSIEEAGDDEDDWEDWWGETYDDWDDDSGESLETGFED